MEAAGKFAKAPYPVASEYHAFIPVARPVSPVGLIIRTIIKNMMETAGAQYSRFVIWNPPEVSMDSRKVPV